MRARLIPWSGPGVGDYLDGQSNGHGYTHGCLCYGEDTNIIRDIWDLPPQKVPVSVSEPVDEP